MSIPKTAKLKLEAMGTLTAAILPDEMLVRLRVQPGDELFAVETPEGYLISYQDPEVTRQIGFGLDGMKEYRETFKRLAG